MLIFVSPLLNVILLFGLSIRYKPNDNKSERFFVSKLNEICLEFLSFISSKFEFIYTDFPFILSHSLILSKFIMPKILSIFLFIRAAFASFNS